MPQTTPTTSSFSASLTLTIIPPSTTNTRTTPPPNILLFLHGLGDTHTPLATLSRNLNLPETLCLSLRGPSPLPFDLGGYHWGDDIQFIQATGTLDMDAGFTKATKMVLGDVITRGLVAECGYRAREVLLWGFGQGGCAALAVVSAAGDGDNPGERELGGVICIGGVLPAEIKTIKQGRKRKCPTPVLLLGGSSKSTLTPSAIERVKDVFQDVEVCLWKREGDGMARNREEMLPIMRFLGRRLRSRKGVPEGAVEVT